MAVVTEDSLGISELPYGCVLTREDEGFFLMAFCSYWVRAVSRAVFSTLPGTSCGEMINKLPDSGTEFRLATFVSW
jgi:hypothetical protein